MQFLKRAKWGSGHLEEESRLALFFFTLFSTAMWTTYSAPQPYPLSSTEEATAMLPLFLATKTPLWDAQIWNSRRTSEAPFQALI